MITSYCIVGVFRGRKLLHTCVNEISRGDNFSGLLACQNFLFWRTARLAKVEAVKLNKTMTSTRNLRALQGDLQGMRSHIKVN